MLLVPEIGGKRSLKISRWCEFRYSDPWKLSIASTILHGILSGTSSIDKKYIFVIVIAMNSNI